MSRFQLSVSITALVCLSACGGGGTNSAGSQAPASTAPGGSDTPAGGSPTAPAADPANPPATSYPSPAAPPTGSVITPASMQPVRSANDTTEFRQNYVANELTNALYALDHGWTGKGVTVAVLDDGVNTSLSAFQGQISSLSKDFGYETKNGVTTKRDRLGDSQTDHGTAVASIIAARADRSGTIGLAPDAKIAVLRTSDYNHDKSLETLARDAEAVSYAAGAGIKIVNRSLASQGFNVGLRNAVTQYQAAGGLLVNSAGNSGGDNPVDAVNVDATNRNAWLFVVAIDPAVRSAYTLAGYSNKAGTMAERTVAAVGTITTTNVDGAVITFSGTSAAAAQVSGLAATILSKWPQLSGVQAGQIIIDTARDIGPKGVDTTFGAGLIDVQAALSPVNPTLSNGEKETAVVASAMALPDVIGSASIQTALSNVAVLDQYGRDFSGSVSSLVVKPEAGRSTWLRRRVARMGGGHGDVRLGEFNANFAYTGHRTVREPNGIQATSGEITSGEMAYRSGRTAIRAGFNVQDSLQQDIMGLAPFADGILAYAPQAGNSLSIDHGTRIGQIGFSLASGSYGRSRATAATASLKKGRSTVRLSWIDEKGSVMGTESYGALALGRGASTAMIELHRSVGIAGDWSLESYGSLGVTRIKIDSLSLVTSATSLIGTRAGIQASGPAWGGLLSFGIAQPLTIEKGAARLTLASGYDLALRSLMFKTVNADLSSSARRLQLTAGYAKYTPWSSFRLGLMQDMTDGSTRALASVAAKF